MAIHPEGPCGGSMGGTSCLFQLLGAPGVLRLAATSLQSLPLLSHGLLPHACQTSLCLSPIRTLSLDFTARPDNLECSLLKVLNSITSAKIPFQIRSPLQFPGVGVWMDLSESLHSAHDGDLSGHGRVIIFSPWVFRFCHHRGGSGRRK